MSRLELQNVEHLSQFMVIIFSLEKGAQGRQNHSVIVMNDSNVVLTCHLSEHIADAGDGRIHIDVGN